MFSFICREQLLQRDLKVDWGLFGKGIGYGLGGSAIRMDMRLLISIMEMLDLYCYIVNMHY